MLTIKRAGYSGLYQVWKKGVYQVTSLFQQTQQHPFRNNTVSLNSKWQKTTSNTLFNIHILIGISSNNTWNKLRVTKMQQWKTANQMYFLIKRKKHKFDFLRIFPASGTVPNLQFLNVNESLDKIESMTLENWTEITV